MMKACFLLSKKLESEHNVLTDFEFHPDDYGPLDPEVYSALEQLEERNLIQTIESEEYEGKEYRLTQEGISRGEELFEELSSSERELISWLKGKHILQSLSQLLSFVYNRYPTFAKNSKLT
jgi:DNA-binding PadR family transcriptional regulator